MIFYRVAVLFIAGWFGLAGFRAEAADCPNIVLIFVDNLGKGDHRNRPASCGPGRGSESAGARSVRQDVQAAGVTEARRNACSFARQRSQLAGVSRASASAVPSS